MPNPVDVFLCDEVRRALPKGRILDLPAGAGELSSQLRDQGLQVTPADLFPERFGAKGLHCVRAESAELNAGLNRQALSLALLCSKEIAIHAQRREGAFVVDDGQHVGSEAGMVALR